MSLVIVIVTVGIIVIVSIILAVALLGYILGYNAYHYYVYILYILYFSKPPNRLLLIGYNITFKNRRNFSFILQVGDSAADFQSDILENGSSNKKEDSSSVTKVKNKDWIQNWNTSEIQQPKRNPFLPTILGRLYGAGTAGKAIIQQKQVIPLTSEFTVITPFSPKGLKTFPPHSRSFELKALTDSKSAVKFIDDENIDFDSIRELLALSSPQAEKARVKDIATGEYVFPSLKT
jgi:hypothetical protein